MNMLKKYLKNKIKEYNDMMERNPDMLPSIRIRFKAKIEVYEEILYRIESGFYDL